MIRAIIIDDEEPARMHIQNLLQIHSSIDIVSIAKNGEDAILHINEQQPEVIFLDIHMPDHNGFEVLNMITTKLPYVIFTTAYEQYALQAFDTFALDYLVKPIHQERFDKAIEKLLRLYKNTQLQKEELLQIRNSYKLSSESKNIHSLAVQNGSKIVLLELSQISYLQADDKYVNIIAIDGKSYLCDKTLTRLEESLPSNFLRIHRSIIVNTYNIDEIVKYFKGRYILIMKDKNKSRVQSSETYKEEIKKGLSL